MMKKDENADNYGIRSSRKIEIEYLMKELQVHQIELETQNEELKRANLETEAALKKYSQLYNAAPIGYFTLDQYGKITKVNTAGAKLLGVDETTLYKRQIQYFVDRESLDDFNEFLTGINETNENQKCRITLHNRQGVPIDTYVEGVSSETLNGPEKQILLAFTDISDLRRIEDELREVHIAERLKNEFFSNVSHEFRTPLNVIFSSLQLLDLYRANDNESIDTTTLYRCMDMMNQNCRRLLRLVNNIIDITRIDSGFFEPVFQNQDIVSIIKAITLSVTQFVESKGLTLDFKDDVGQKIIACDSELMERVMLNLLSNAVKFTKPGGNITVWVYKKEYKIFISIKDTGIGIPKDKLDKIFQRFIQVDKTLTRENEGSGIGLNLVRSIIQMHEGKITVTSDYGKGSDFLIELPIKTLCEKVSQNQTRCIQEDKNIAELTKVEFSDIY